MIDVEMYGLNSGGHHLTNLLLHSANAALLLLLLKSITRNVWCSVIVAALFAWHPLRVESVAWAAERKDVLSTFFFLLTLIAYSRYVELKTSFQDRKTELRDERSKPDDLSSASTNRDSKSRIPHSAFGTRPYVSYCLALMFFALGLMSKAMLVSVPFVLLLLDFWPLQRFARLTQTSLKATVRYALLEKLPFFALSLAGCLVTLVVSKNGGAMATLSGIPLETRLATAVVSYARYISKLLWPSRLAIFYPYEDYIAWFIPLGAALLLLLLTLFCWSNRQRHPYLLTGWCWFLGTLVPAIGLVQVGAQSMADRYTYIPSIGVFIMVAWGLHRSKFWATPFRQYILSGTLAVLMASLICTSAQLRFWKDGKTLFEHALEVTTNNYIAYEQLSKSYHDSGNIDTALKFCLESVRIRPDRVEARYNLGTLLLELGRNNEAVTELSEAVRLDPNDADAEKNLGVALVKQGNRELALSHFSKATQLAPENTDVRLNFGLALLEQRDLEKAIAQFREGLRLNPKDPRLNYNLGLALEISGATKEAVGSFRQTLRLSPNSPEVLSELALNLACSTDLDVRAAGEAIELAQRACRLTQNADPGIIMTLATAYAENGSCSEGGQRAARACEIALLTGDSALAARATQLVDICNTGSRTLVQGYCTSATATQ
jgi:Flp pilus assembly protein TadD